MIEEELERTSYYQKMKERKTIYLWKNLILELNRYCHALFTSNKRATRAARSREIKLQRIEMAILGYSHAFKMIKEEIKSKKGAKAPFFILRNVADTVHLVLLV